MPARLQEEIGVTDYVVQLSFQATNVGDAAGTAYGIEATSPEYVIPFAGAVIGISVAHNAALTGGVITWNPTIDGTAKTALGAVTKDVAQRASAKVDSTKVAFTSGQRLGVAWTKTGTVAPTTTDVIVTLFVLITGVAL